MDHTDRSQTPSWAVYLQVPRHYIEQANYTVNVKTRKKGSLAGRPSASVVEKRAD